MDSPTADFIHDAAKAAGPMPPSDQKEPQVPFQGGLKLTREQETQMLDHAFRRFKDISNELGRDQTLQPTWWANLQPTPNLQAAAQGLLPAMTFLGKRSRFDATFMNDVSWRPYTMGVENIFMSSNIAVPLSRRICAQMIARAKKALFGSDPWFSAEPWPGQADPLEDAQIDLIERYCRMKAKEGKTKVNMGRAITQALILGECAVKTTYVVRDQIFDTEARVLVDVNSEPGKVTPMRDQKGNTITEDAKWQDKEDGLGTKVLASDGVTPQPDAPVYQKVPLTRRQVLFEGAVSEPIYYKDFGLPQTAASVQEADTCYHIYDKQVAEFVDLIVKRGMVDDNPQGRASATHKMIALLRTLDQNSQEPKAAVDLAIRPLESMTPLPATPGGGPGPVAEFIEFYLWWDANGDGIAENIMLIADRASQKPIFYDHVANVTTDGLRPIEIVRIKPIEGRWYGQGIMEYFDCYQTIVDLMVNRWNFSQSRAGYVLFWSPKNTLEGDRDPSLKMNFGGTYTKKQNMKAEDCVEVVYLNDTKFEALHTMIQYFMQLAMNESGVTNANDNQAAGMQSAKLATGIMQIEQSGDELFMPILEDLTDPLTGILNREISVVLANLDPDEFRIFCEGETDGVDMMTADDVRGLRLRCDIELTTHRNQQILQLSSQAVALVKDYYTNPPNLQVILCSLYRRQLRILDPQANADEVIVPQQAPSAPPGEQPAGGSDIGNVGNGVAPAQMTQAAKPAGALSAGAQAA
jgi:hypothetical protein